MTIPTVKQQQFIQVLRAINDAETVYVIPSFQRPYAWESKQILDMEHDMQKAAAFNAYHYFAPLHLIPLNFTDPTHLIDQFITHAKPIVEPAIDKQGLVISTNLVPVDFYAVVDGQQRLTTLFLLGHIFYASLPNRNRLNLQVEYNGQIIPRLIQNPVADHQFMMDIVEHIWNQELNLPIPKTQSQQRMLNAYNHMQKWDQSTIGFLSSINFRTLAMELIPSYGLTSFMILNDRANNCILI